LTNATELTTSLSKRQNMRGRGCLGKTCDEGSLLSALIKFRV
jgi:hypothetical protein